MLFFSFRTKKEKTFINIHYTLNYEGDSWEKNRTGLLWALSYLGAELPRRSFDSSITWINKQTFRLNFAGIGFDKSAQQALEIICDSLKATDVYRKTKAIDLGHFIALTLGSSWHYYKITHAPKSYQEFITLHKFTSYEIMPITRSTISHHHRLLKMSLRDPIQESVFIAEEGEGQVNADNFSTKEYEVMDIMKNGQLRFMVYNEAGALIPAGKRDFGEAGKPVKCIWCHEINIQPLFTATDTIKGFLSPGEFQEKIKTQNKRLNTYRASLNSDINFTHLQDHTYQELIYISFMEPSARRLSQEWCMSEKDVMLLLKSLPTHKHHEFTFLGEMYERKALHNRRYGTGALPSSIREENDSEPDFFNR